MTSASPKSRRAFRLTLKILLGLVATLVLLVGAAVWVAWFRPHWILTDERVSSLAGRFLHREDRAPVSTTIAIDRPDARSRIFRLALAPGCYRTGEESAPGFRFCADRAAIAFTIRYYGWRRWFPDLKLQALNELNILVTRASLPESDAGAEETPTVESGPPGWLKFIAPDFSWGPLRVEARDVRVGSQDLTARALLTHPDTETLPSRGAHGLRSPDLKLTGSAEDRSFRAKVDGTIAQRGMRIVLSGAKAEYRGKTGKPTVVTATVDAVYDLEKAEISARFGAEWKDPHELVSRLTARDGAFRIDAENQSVHAHVLVAPRGKTPAGAPPALAFKVGADVHQKTEKSPKFIDLSLDLEHYQFAGVSAESDLRVRILPHPKEPQIELRKGSLRVDVRNFGELVRVLERTSWAIPAPFAVLKGTISLRTEPFRNLADRTEIPFLLVTNLESQEQAVKFETRAHLELARANLKPKKAVVATLVRSIKLRLPDYEPIAPVPAFTRDPRIVRDDGKENDDAKKTGARKNDEDGFPIELKIDAPPGSIVFLNRFFVPALSAGAKFSAILGVEGSAPTGEVSLSGPMVFRYLNREVTVERLRFSLTPELQVSCRVSMKRSGYLVYATVEQTRGRTRISLGSEPPLQEDEIVSLLLYGMPKNSISSEQTRSVGSAQSAMAANAVGVLSFFVFASTPIETVMYDPATQTYSAVVRLPGGLVGSVGSNWENDKQVSLSKSLGRNWAVSTELVRDAEGVDRGGTLLRWRKSY